MKRITAADAKKLQDEGWTYVDVRTEGEFAAGHPTGSINIPMNNPNFLSVLQSKFKPDSRLIIGCQVGGRSMRATAFLEQNGFTQLVDNAGGFDGWLAAKLPSAKGAP
jgi:rhodanese-related sulfurtransferase